MEPWKDLIDRIAAIENIILNQSLDTKEAAEFTGYSVATIKKYSKEIGCYSRGRKLLFKRQDLIAWMNRYKR